MAATKPRVCCRCAATATRVFLLSTFSGIALANPGDLDPSFGIGGRAFIDFPNILESATSIVQASDGKLLVGRMVFYDWPAVDDFSVVRLNTDGTIDQTFGTDGRAFADAGEQRGVTLAVRETADGKIVVAGEATNQGGFAERFALVRYTAAGALDTSFGIDGVATGTLNGRATSFQALVEQPDGKLVAAGYVVTASGDSDDMVIARFDTTGSLDETFGTDGYFSLDFFAAGESDGAYELVRQPDGRFVVAGRAIDGTGKRHVVLFRTMEDGSLDATFGSSGLVALDIDDLARANISLQQQEDGKLVLSAQTFDESTQACTAVIARMESDGTLDATLNDSGIVQLPLERCIAAGGSSIAVDPQGGIVVGNTVLAHTYPSRATITRLTPTGQVDGTFGVDGTTIIDTGSAWGVTSVDPTVGIKLLRQSDGRIALAVSDQFDWWFGGGFFLVARLLADGSSAGLIGFVFDYAAVDEPAESITVAVQRTGGALGAVSIDFATTVDSATSEDFTSTAGTLTWADGDRAERTITIPVTDDTQSEDDEGFLIKLSNPTGEAEVATSQMYIVIEDDEPRPASPPLPSPVPPPSPSTPTAPNPFGSGGGGPVDGFFLIALLAMLVSAQCRSTLLRRIGRRR